MVLHRQNGKKPRMAGIISEIQKCGKSTALVFQKLIQTPFSKKKKKRTISTTWDRRSREEVLPAIPAVLML